MNGRLSALIGLAKGERVAVVGCGGKTSLIGLLAEENRTQRVLVMPTTKIFPPVLQAGMLKTGLAACLAHEPQPGVQCLGVLNDKTGKLEAPPPQHWPRLAAGYDLVLMEADGSRGLPCKGWLAHEPQIPDLTTLTLGVASLAALGRGASQDIVLNLPVFLQLTGLNEGDAIGAEALAAMVGAPNGMLEKARGRRVVLFNQAEGDQAKKGARQAARTLRQHYPGRAELLLAGSVQGCAFWEV